ncbi:hypothetical protein BpHYR1_053140 [Brachionus plicatilis]|uniref:Uncharacterized protein n=1 Tax=Brachionus plicatilis TaxID=10195 RepID=A0A3M7SE41_BRAPC|nr:hypothetical protein BpHYR1_053140 [Brachionus plicatilis]
MVVLNLWKILNSCLANLDDNKLISVSKTADQNEENKKNKKKKKIKIHKSKDVDDFDDEIGKKKKKLLNRKPRVREKNGKNFKIFVLDTESEYEEAESKTPEAIEDVDLNMLLKSFNQISLESTKTKCQKLEIKRIPEKKKMP